MFETFEEVDAAFSQFEKKFEGESLNQQFSAFVESQRSLWHVVASSCAQPIWDRVFASNLGRLTNSFEFNEKTGEFKSDIPILGEKFRNVSQIKNSDIRIYFMGCVNFYLCKTVAKASIADGSMQRNGNLIVPLVEFSTLINLIAPSRSYVEISGRSQKIDKIIDGWENKFQNLENSVRKKFQIEKSVKHWSDLSKKYRNSHLLQYWSFNVFCAAPFLAIALVMKYIGIPKIADLILIKDIAYPMLGSFALLMVPYFWILRRLAIGTSSAMRLKIDATYRSSLLSTFLAMNSEDETKLSEAERAIFLNALFRPIEQSDKEDFAPPSVLDLLKPPGKSP